MPNLKKHFTDDYIKFSFITLILVLISSVVICIFLLYSKLEHLDNNLRTTSTKIENFLEETFEYTNSINVSIGRKIARDEEQKPERILEIIRENTTINNGKSQHLFSWSFLDWMNSQNLQIVNSKSGIIENPPDMSHRDYAKSTRNNPWKLQFSKPAVGIPSGVWIIPAATGITNEKDKYLGAITLGFNIAILNEKISNFINNVSYLVVDENYNIVLQSFDNGIDPKSFEKQEELKKLFNNKLEEIDFSHHDVTYSFARKIKNYPYTILVGFHNTIINKEIYGFILPYIFFAAILLIFFLLILYFFRRYIITPVTELTDVAEKISQGELAEVPQGRLRETSRLAEQLNKVGSLITEEKEAKQELAKAIEMVRTSSQAKQGYIKQLRKAMKKPLESIMHSLQVLATHLSKDSQVTLTYEEARGFVRRAYRGTMNVYELVSDEVAETCFDFEKVIDEAIAIKSEEAVFASTSLEKKIERNLPVFCGDEFRLRQVIIALIHRSLFVTNKGKITISAETKPKKGKKKKLIIKVEDNGVAFSDSEREKIFETSITNVNGIMFVTDETELSRTAIEKVIQLHNGKITYKEEKGKGSTVIIELPLKDIDKTDDDLPDNIVSFRKPKIF